MCDSFAMCVVPEFAADDIPPVLISYIGCFLRELNPGRKKEKRFGGFVKMMSDGRLMRQKNEEETVLFLLIC